MDLDTTFLEVFLSHILKCLEAQSLLVSSGLCPPKVSPGEAGPAQLW